MKIKASFGMCSLYVNGMEMTCPFCGVRVRDGEQHNCEMRTPKPKPKPATRKRPSRPEDLERGDK